MTGTCPKHGAVVPCGGWSPGRDNPLHCNSSIPHCPTCGKTISLEEDEVPDDCTSDETCDHPTHYTGCPQDEDPTAGFDIPQDRW